MTNSGEKIAISDAKYSIKFWLHQNKTRELKKKNENAPGHVYSIIDLTKSFNLALEELSDTGVSMQKVKVELYKELPDDIVLLSKLCDSLARRLPQTNLESYILGQP